MPAAGPENLLPFVHLRARSAYSLLEGAMKVPDLVRLVATHDMPALALTDRDNLFGAIEFSEAMREAKRQPIMGCGLTVIVPREGIGAKPIFGTLALLAQDETGWRRLMELSSQIYLQAGEQDRAALTLADICANNQGLIALTGGYEGPIDQLLRAGKMKDAAALCETLRNAFADRLYVEIQRHGRPDEERIETQLLDLTYRLDLPVVATNEPFFEDQARYSAHDALLCIAAGAYVAQPDRRRLTREHYFKSTAQMNALFADMPEALRSTIEIAQRCAYRPKTRAPILPHFSSAEGADEAESLRVRAKDGLRGRLQTGILAAPEADYWQRLDHELNVIIGMQFPGYFLIVSDFIQWAKNRGIPVGPGRGSGAGSLVAWALSITDLDPLRFGLLFERFLNPERVSMPDFDIDFCQDRRGEVIRYVQNKYGEDRVAQIITFGSLQARAVVRDVGRVMEVPFGVVDNLAKLVPQNPAKPINLAQALELEPKIGELRENNTEIDALLKVALELEGLYRNASTHAAGIVIGDRPLIQLSPLYRDPRSDIPATQYNMKWVESAGLVKFDFLGLKTLTVIDKARRFLRQRGIEVDFENGDYSDEKAYALMASGHSLGVFQLESQGMRDTLRKVRPDCLEDIIALISLYRPGPMKNIDTYVEVKSGRKKADYLHPSLEPILKETHGVIVYQEQVMQIAQILSGYSLGEADLLRRAMGKKKKEEMDKQKERFVAGAAKNGVSEEQSGHIFELVAEFAGYGFNKSHAAAYAVIGYQTAYLKANHPAEFIAASMSLEIADTDKLAAYHQEARRLKIPVMGPDINKSDCDFSVVDGKIFYALGAVKIVGMSALASLILERAERGPFRNLEDFAARIDPKGLNRRALENLARAGAFDCLKVTRAGALAASERMLAVAQRTQFERDSAQNSLFGEQTPLAAPVLDANLPEFPMASRLDQEFASIGFYLSGHPLDDVLSGRAGKMVVFARALKSQTIGEGVYRMAGVVLRKNEKTSQNGNRFAFVTFSDPTGEFELTIMPDAFAQCRAWLEAGRSVALRVRAKARDGELRFAAETVEPIESFLGQFDQVDGLRILLNERADIREVKEILLDSELAKTGSSGNSGSAGNVRRIVDNLKDDLHSEHKDRPARKPVPVEIVLKTSIGMNVILKTRRDYSGSIAVQQRLRNVPGVERVEEL